MNLSERTQDIYEKIPSYPLPPLIPLPSVDDLDDFSGFGVVMTPASRRILRAAMRISGLQTFVNQAPSHIEQLLRRVNIRGPALYAPAVSATLALEDDPRQPDPFQRAATLLLAARSLYDDVWSGALPPDQFKDHPLEMGQYPNLFATHIIVDPPNPRIFKSTNHEFITILIQGRYFTLDVWDNQVPPPTVYSIAYALRKLSEYARRTPLSEDQPSPGSLTATDDAFQIRAFRELGKISENRHSLDIIRHSFLVLCLDLDDTPANTADAALIAQSRNYSNRWFHASLQLIVFGNAKACLVCAFSAYLDGNVMMRGASEIQQRALRHPLETHTGTASPSLPDGQELTWKISPGLLVKAQKSIAAVLDPEAKTVQIEGIGRQQFADHKLQAIPAFTIALVMAAYKVTGNILKITQFVSMSRYRCMDLTTAMITTPEVEKFVKAAAIGESSAETRDLLAQAIDSQRSTIHEIRSRLTLDDLLYYYIHTLKGFKQFYVITILGLALISLRLLKLLKLIGREVATSHPEIYPGVLVVGRPGVSLPYVRDFGLHYQVFPKSITITWMGGRNKQIDFITLADALKQSLEQLFKIMAD